MTTNETRKPRVEVTEESQETLEVLDLDRTPRPEKMAREARHLDDAHEARFAEREFIPRRRASLDDVRASVDALTPRRTEFPEPREAAPLPPPEPAPSAPPAIPEELRVALEPLVPGELQSVEVLHREGNGHVVEAAYVTPRGGPARALYVVTDGAARPFDDIAARVDALPAPVITSAPVEVEKLADAAIETRPAAPSTETATAPAPKGLRSRFGRKQAEPEPEAPAPATVEAPPAEGEPKAKKGLLGKLGRKAKKADDEPAAEEAAPEASAEEAPASKRRFGFGRK